MHSVVHTSSAIQHLANSLGADFGESSENKLIKASAGKKEQLTLIKANYLIKSAMNTASLKL